MATNTVQKENMFFLYNFPVWADLYMEAGQLFFFKNYRNFEM